MEFIIYAAIWLGLTFLLALGVVYGINAWFEWRARKNADYYDDWGLR